MFLAFQWLSPNFSRLRVWRSPPWPSLLRGPVLFGALILLVLGGPLGCRKPERPLEPRSITWAELRSVRLGVHLTPPGAAEREPYFRERLADGTRIRVASQGLAWLRRDAGATLLVRGPADLTLRANSVAIGSGRVFLDCPPDTTTELETPRGTLSLTEVRTSVDVLADGTVRAYVLSGEARAAGARARAGEALTLRASGAPEVTPVRAFNDWTGGLATTDRAAAPAPYGVGTVGARRPGDQGAPRFPLAIQRLAVHVTFEGDFAITEVDQTFFNPSSDSVEGMYGFRTPERATLERFGVDRDGVVVWGHVKERAAAAQQYQQNVYRGSTEDPALLEWDAPGVYKARLYPIGPGASRRVVVRYAEWLDRTGPAAERRLYVYPMAAEGAEASLPHIEELTVSFDLERAGAKEVRAGMTGVRAGSHCSCAGRISCRAPIWRSSYSTTGRKHSAATAPSTHRTWTCCHPATGTRRSKVPKRRQIICWCRCVARSQSALLRGSIWRWSSIPRPRPSPSRWPLRGLRRGR